MTLEEERLRGKTDLMFLAVDVLGMDFQEIPHRELFSCFLQCKPGTNLSDLDKQIKKRMILWPRGLFKTTAVRVAIVQLLLNYPDCRILIGAATLGLGKPQLAAIKRWFEFPTPKFLELYPEYCGKKLGNTTHFNLPNRKDFALPESNVTTSTAKAVKAGSHYDFLFIDDLVNDQNYQKPELLESCWQDYLDFGPLRDPGGYLVVTGTPYIFGDTYERIEKAALDEMKEKRSPVWRISTNTCWIEYCAKCEKPDTWHESRKVICEFKPSGKKEVLFPETQSKRGRTIGHTVEFLESEKREKGEEFFGCQYECRRLSKGRQTFTQELLDRQTLYHFERPMQESEMERIALQMRELMAKGKKFDEALAEISNRPASGEIPIGGWHFIIGDLAYIGLENKIKKRDECVFYIIRVVNGALYAIACNAGKWKSGEVGLQIVMMLLKYRPRVIWLEAFLGWEAFDTVIKMVAANKGIRTLPLEWIPMNCQEDAKVIRIGSIHGWLDQKKLWLFAGMDHFDKLIENLLKWPKLGRHDDYGDCLGLAVNAPHAVGLEKIPKIPTTTLEQIKARMYPNGLPFSSEFEEPQDSYSANGCGSGIVC